MVWKAFLMVALMPLVALPAAWAQQTIAISGGRLLTVTHGVIENGTVLVEDGKIKAVGTNVSIPRGAKVIDASDARDDGRRRRVGSGGNSRRAGYRRFHRI